MTGRGAIALLVALAAGPAPVGAQASVAERIVSTRHAITVSGRRLTYTARAGRLPIRVNETGEAYGYVFFVAYTLDRSPGQPVRPLTMLWNGGPGANSALVHLVGFGPRRIVARRSKAGNAGEYAIEDNASTWLDATDLVFVDPVGTGYARLARTEYAAEFYGTLGDIAAVAEFVRTYLTHFNAWDAPLFVGGERFGVWRAAGVAEMLERRGIPVAGEILISGGIPALAAVPYAMKAALFLPTRTAAALYHHRLSDQLQRDPSATLRLAATWARDEYAPALARSESLSVAQRAAVVAQLSRLSGLDTTLIDHETLIVKRGDFGRQLLHNRHLVLGRFDSRLTFPADVGGEYTAGSSRDPLVVRYLQVELRYKTDLAYLGSEAGYRPVTDTGATLPGERWAWDQNQPPKDTSAVARAAPAAAAIARRLADDGPPNGAEPWLRRTLEIDPSLQAFVAVGLYDSLNSCAWNDYLVGSLDAATRGNIAAHCYAGGHMMYEDGGTRIQLHQEVAAFIRNAAAASRA